MGLFSDAPHRRVNGGLGGPPGVTIPGTTFSHPGQELINEDLLYAHALATDHTWYGMG